MQTDPAPTGARLEARAHWVEIVDGQGLLPVRLLGPYASAPQADRARRGVMRLLNPVRYTACVRSLGSSPDTADFTRP